MAIRKDAEYAFSMFMKADSTYAGTVKVKVVDDSGAALTNEAALELKKDGTWQKDRERYQAGDACADF